MPSTILKRHARLRTSRDSERSAVWLELFFDLVFVLANVLEICLRSRMWKRVKAVLSHVSSISPV